MNIKLDQTDLRILRALQIDSARSQRALADDLGMSQNAFWRRLKRLETEGAISGYSARINHAVIGRTLIVFTMVRTRTHSADWMRTLKHHLESIPEVVSFYRIGGDYDYMLKIQTDDIAGFDRVYQRITENIQFENVTSYFTMEAIFEDRPGIRA